MNCAVFRIADISRVLQRKTLAVITIHIVGLTQYIGGAIMALPRLTKLELQIMETFWTRGACSVREIQEAFPEKNRPAYTTVQTTIYRLERKKTLRLVK